MQQIAQQVHNKRHKWSLTINDKCIELAWLAQDRHADRMLNRRAAASAAVLVLRGWPTTGQTDRQTDTRQMHYAYHNRSEQRNEASVGCLSVCPVFLETKRHTFNGRLIGNNMWPIEWHQC